MSMGAVRSYQMAQAWLAAARSRETGHAAQVKVARALASAVEGDPNGLGKPHASAIRALRAMLAGG